eukprot:gene10238-1850_t
MSTCLCRQHRQAGRPLLYCPRRPTGSELYVVPYNELRNFIVLGSCRTEFASEWRACLRKANEDFDSCPSYPSLSSFSCVALPPPTAMGGFWREIFHGISGHKETRGAAPADALTLFVATSEVEVAAQALSRLKCIHATATLNTDALRKIVKKFDKQQCSVYVERAPDCGLILLAPSNPITNLPAHPSSGTPAQKVLSKPKHINLPNGDRVQAKAGAGPAGSAGESLLPLSVQLLPEAYTAGFLVSQPMLEAYLCLFRDLFEGPYSSMDQPTSKGGLWNKMESSARDRRKNELSWLRQVVGAIPPSQAGSLVAHRGFHCTDDRTGCRPLENSLSAYEAAWTCGMRLCE